MKLISCYIENFGNIKQRNVAFERGLTSLCEHNGYGKTTLACFLKAMFYGLKQTTARDREMGERARFYPFEGGKFGGNVVFERDGKTCKIERFFGRKSATEDTLTVYENGQVIVSCTDPGKEFFGLDEQSFLRTVFLNSNDTESGATGDISRMLNGFVDDADFEGAKKFLEKQRKEYKADRGRGGKIDEKHDEILRLKDTIENKEKINEELTRKYEERKKKAQAVAVLEGQQNTSRDKNLVLHKWQTYDGFALDAEVEKGRLDKLLQKYPAGVPGEEEIRTLKRCAEDINLAKQRLATSVFNGEKQDRLSALSQRFSAGVPTNEEIASANDTSSEIIRLDAEISNYEKLLLCDGRVAFPAGVPDGEELTAYEEKLKSLRKKNGQTSSAVKKIPVVFALCALILLCAGAGLLIADKIAGGVFLAVGAVSAFVAIFTYFKAQINGIKASSSVNGDCENEIRSFLARYGYYSDGGIEVDFNNLKRDAEAYSAGVEEREKYQRLLNEKRAEAERAKARVGAFLSRYSCVGENVQAELTRLGALTAEYTALKGEKEDLIARGKAGREQLEKSERTVGEIFAKYGISPHENVADTALAIERDASEINRLKESVQRLEKRASEFRSANGLTERPAGGEENVKQIDAELSQKREELSLLDREIAEDEASVERLAELKEELDAAQEEEATLKNRYSVIIKTLSLLERAEGNLKDRYVSPVKNSFLNYSGLLEKVLGEKVVFDKDFKIKFERAGELRSDGHLSAGQKSLCALCLRLALVDNMYKGEKPFVIMDDPFVHLDNEHMKRAQSLLKELAKSRQIVYFCCHESRQI